MANSPSGIDQAGILAAVLAALAAIAKVTQRITGAKVRVVDPDCERRLSELERRCDEESSALRHDLSVERESRQTMAVQLAVALERIAHLEQRLP